jgi:hypothetical protein
MTYRFTIALLVSLGLGLAAQQAPFQLTETDAEIGNFNPRVDADSKRNMNLAVTAKDFNEIVGQRVTAIPAQGWHFEYLCDLFDPGWEWTAGAWPGLMAFATKEVDGKTQFCSIMQVPD